MGIGTQPSHRVFSLPETEYPLLLYRYLVRRYTLRKITNKPRRLIVSLFNEFSTQGFFQDSLNTLKQTDQWKAYVLYFLCRITEPDVIIETGIAAGHSSLGILSALKRNGKGHLHSIDLPGFEYRTDDGNVWKDMSSADGPGWLVPSNLRDRWTIHIGPSRKVLPVILEDIESIDVFYHDSEHTKENMRFEMQGAWTKLKTGGYLLADNINWNSAFADFCRDKNYEGRVLFPYLGIIRKR